MQYVVLSLHIAYFFAVVLYLVTIDFLNPRSMIKKLLFTICLLGIISSLEAQETNTVSSTPTVFEEQVFLFPNPADNFIKISNLSGEEVEVAVYNVLGDAVIRTVLSKIETSFDLSKIPSGVYIVAYTNDKKTITERLIKK